MRIVRQLLAAFAVIIVAAAVWLRLDPAAGTYLLSADSPLPDSLRPAVAAIAPTGGAPSVGATPQRGEGARPAPLVVVDAAKPQVTRDRLRAVGTGEAERTVAVYPETSGLVTEIHFRPGDNVSRGDVLVQLENESEALALDRARIAVEAAVAQVERYRALASSAAAVTTVQVEEVERTLQTARLDLRAAEIALDRRAVVAPIDGRIGLTDIEIGALVGNQTLLATIDDRDRLKVAFLAPEGFVPDLSIGTPLQATPATRTGRTYSGEISALDSRIDETSRTLRVEALIDNAADDLRPGMSFGIEIAFPGEEFLSVDPLAIQWERAGPFVWIVDAKTVRKASVAIIERGVERVLVASQDVSVGDAVVVEGIQSLREGIAVRIRDEPVEGDDRGPAPTAEPVAEGSPAGGAPDGRRAAVGTAAASEVPR